MARRFNSSRLILVALGVGLGFLARLVLGVPAENIQPSRTFDQPLVEPADEVIDLPLIKRESESGDNSGIVPVIKISAESSSDSIASLWNDNFGHDDSALFEPHGEQICASGCALSRHPTDKLSRARFNNLIKRVGQKPLDENNTALEELIFFGPQTRQMLNSLASDQIENSTREFLRAQLQLTHALISIRVVDESGTVRTWLDATQVPFDRRHVFEMETQDLQPLVTSGTVKRVGLNHLWTRL